MVFTNATGYAVANANFSLPGFYNVSATFPGNTTTTPTLNAVAAFAGCARRLSASFSRLHAQASAKWVCVFPYAANDGWSMQDKASSHLHMQCGYIRQCSCHFYTGHASNL